MPEAIVHGLGQGAGIGCHLGRIAGSPEHGVRVDGNVTQSPLGEHGQERSQDRRAVGVDLVHG